MNTRFWLLCLGLLGVGWGRADDLVLEVIRGERWVQTGPAVAEVTRATAAPGFYFEARLAGLTAFEPVIGAQLAPPSGAVVGMLKTPGVAGEYGVVKGYASVQERSAAFPVGRYGFAATINLIGAVTAHANLPDGAGPPAPHVLGYAALQTIDPGVDAVMRWDTWAGATDADAVQLMITDPATGEVVLDSGSLAGGATDYQVAAGGLPSDRALTLRLVFRRVLDSSMPDGSDLFGGRSLMVAETAVAIRTKPAATGGGGGGGLSSAQLIKVSPGMMEHLASRFDPFVLTFSEPMDPSGTGLSWAGLLQGASYTLDPAKLRVQWLDGNRTLAVSYDPNGVGWLMGMTVSWAVNDQPGAAGNLKDATGKEVARQVGAFLTAVGVDPCTVVGGTLPDVSFYFSKQVNYLQTNTDVAVGDPVRGAEAMAFFGSSAVGADAAIVTLKVPTANPYAFLLKVLTPVVGAGAPAYKIFEQHFSSRAELDDVYIGGTYQMELRDGQAKATNTVALTVPLSGYPPTPHYSNFDAAQAVAANAAFLLGWDPFTGATTNTAGISLVIYDAATNVVFHAPDPCKGVVLLPDSSGVTIPVGVFQAGSVYTAELGYSRVTDSGKTLAGVPGKGMAFLGRTTRMTLKTQGNGSGGSLAFRSIQAVGDGQLELSLDCVPGRKLVVELAQMLGPGFAPIVLTNPPVTPMVFRIPMTGNYGVLRARLP